MPVTSNRRAVTTDQKNLIRRVWKLCFPYRWLFPNSRSLSSFPRGFTLVELLVTVSIIAILSAIGLGSYRNFARNQEVRNAALKLKTDLRKYQTYAISGQKNPDPARPDCNDDSRPMNYYSVEISTGSYEASLFCNSEATNVPLADAFPWSAEVSVFAVGHEAKVCAPLQRIIIHFRPINEGVELSSQCGAVLENVWVIVTNSSGATYMVVVTNAGEIYDRKLP